MARCSSDSELLHTDSWLASDADITEEASSSSDEPEYKPSGSVTASDELSIDPDAACEVCRKQHNPSHMVVCEGCNGCYHFSCLRLNDVPEEDEWFCPTCLEEIARLQLSALKDAGPPTTRPTGTAAAAAADAATAAAALPAAAAADASDDGGLAADDDAMAPSAQGARRARASGRRAPTGRPRGRPRRTAQQVAAAAAAVPNIIQVSITVAIKTADVTTALFEKMFKWVETQPAGAVALERGGVYGHLHIQGVAKVNALIKHALWGGVVPRGAVVCIKKLTGRSLHTWHGMIGYVFKDERQPWFRVLTHNITDGDIEIGRDEYLKHGAGALKKKTALTPKSLFDKAMLYYQMHMSGQERNNLSFPQVLLRMLRSGKFAPSASWLIPYQARGMSYDRVEAMWTMLTVPTLVTPRHVHLVFFEAPASSANRGFSFPLTSQAGDAALLRVLQEQFGCDMPATGDNDWAPAPQPLRREDMDDGGLGAALGVAPDRTAREEGDNVEYWQLVRAQMSSLLDLPGSSAEAQALSAAVSALDGLLADDDDAFVIDLAGAYPA